MVGVRRFELLTSSVSGKRSPPELNARISAAGVAARSILRENAHVTQPSIASFSRITNTAQREERREPTSEAGRAPTETDKTPTATDKVLAATNKALPAPPKPNLRVNSSAPRRPKPSTCASSRHESPTGAINPQVSGGGAAGKASAGRKSPSGVKTTPEGPLCT